MSRAPRSFRALVSLLVSLLSVCLPALAAEAQTDFYNTDRGRPLTVEDALVIERHAFELQAAPLRLIRVRRGLTQWGVAPELAFGLLPRTQLELSLPFTMDDDVARARPTVALAGVELDLLHQLNTETMRYPALAVGASVEFEAGPHSPSRTVASLRALATRTLSWGRVHANAAYTPGTRLAATDPAAGELDRWMAGLAVDRTLALRALLLGADLTARESMLDDGEVQWSAGIGLRQQVTPRLAMDAGLRRNISAGGPAWEATVGGALAFALPGARAFRPERPARATPAAAAADIGAVSQWSRVYEQFYLPAPHNFAFRRDYPGADRLFNAFDFGHATLYEQLLTRRNDAQRRLEGETYRFLTEELLNRPPRLPLIEDAIEPTYSRLAPEAKAMFEWAHVLHRQVYDVLADERLDGAAKGRELQRLEAYYLSRRDVAFSTRPKSMALMQEQPYSLAFRNDFPKFNGLIWAYHWLQVGLYEPLVTGTTIEARQAGVAATVARFRQMLQGPPEGFPVLMPMTGAVAPEFARRWPTLAIIFDNLHSMHDVISDILANPTVPIDEKRGAILRAAAAYRDDTTEVMTVEGWRRMTVMMGVHNQGGPAVGFLPALPKPTVPRGAVMRHDKDGNPIGAHHEH